ncbi:MAG: GNAT family N-acetyltransferase [Candidatus Paceibacterota bacterium]|jgi:GNAT superfamily N-acetyltransferase
MANIRIDTLRSDFSKEDVAEINGLLRELSSNVKPVGADDISSVVQGGILFVAREEEANEMEKIVGIASLIPYTKLSGTVARVEDVVVAETHRGQGIGKKLMEAALSYKWTEGAKVPAMIELTSNPSRIAANKLYQSLGFEKYDTNVYRRSIRD